MSNGPQAIPFPRSTLASIAKSLGRIRSKRGKEPTYENEAIRTLPPLSIPGHTNDLKTGTACCILDTLLDDVDELRNQLEAQPAQDLETPLRAAPCSRRKRRVRGVDPRVSRVRCRRQHGGGGRLDTEAAATSWIEAALDLGQVIPVPVQTHGYSGKVVLRMPRGLHKGAAEAAVNDGTSLNQLLVTAIATYVAFPSATTHAVAVLMVSASLASYSSCRASYALYASSGSPVSTNHVHPAMVNYAGGGPLLLLGDNKFVQQVSKDRLSLSGATLRLSDQRGKEETYG